MKTKPKPNKPTQTHNEILDKIAKAGVTNLKFELEAHLDRGESFGSHYDDCDDCRGGRVDCDNCSGRGVVTLARTTNGNSEITEECNHCDGDGYITCDYCDGSGRVEADNDDWSASMCLAYILKYMGIEYSELMEGHTEDSSSARALGLGDMSYAEFYNDGSVDSEFTFTLPIDKAHLAVKASEAIRALADEIGNGLNVEGAGAHITALWSDSYPADTRLQADKIENFRTEVSKLLPALFLMCSPDGKSRGMQYRYPRVSRNDKYSAIYTHGDTCIEYRLPETCYDEPEMLWEYLSAIAGTLEFYSNKVIPMKELGYVLPETYQVQGMYQTKAALKALNNGLTVLKPTDKTVAEIKRKRKVNVTFKDIARKEAKLMAEAARKYADYIRRWERDRKLQLEYYLDVIKAGNIGLSSDQMRLVAEGRAKEVVEQLEVLSPSRPITLRQYQNNYIRQEGGVLCAE